MIASRYSYVPLKDDESIQQDALAPMRSAEGPLPFILR
jgi:hypothetical protein